MATLSLFYLSTGRRARQLHRFSRAGVQNAKMLPISNIDFLSICATDMDDSVNWVELFKRPMKVTTIQVIGRGTNSLVWALTTPKATADGKGKKKRYDDSAQARSTGAPADAPIFPKLTFLVLNSLDFCEGPLPSGVLFYVVERGLHQRKAASKAQLKVLRADNCVISAKRAKALQKLVQQFGTTGTGMSLRFPGLF